MICDSRYIGLLFPFSHIRITGYIYYKQGNGCRNIYDSCGLDLGLYESSCIEKTSRFPWRIYIKRNHWHSNTNGFIRISMTLLNILINYDTVPYAYIWSCLLWIRLLLILGVHKRRKFENFLIFLCKRTIVSIN